MFLAAIAASSLSRADSLLGLMSCRPAMLAANATMGKAEAAMSDT